MEVPYYAGAFGAAALSDSVHASHALVFMAGTNIAAGLYEYGLARLTRALLARPRPSPHARRGRPSDVVDADSSDARVWRAVAPRARLEAPPHATRRGRQPPRATRRTAQRAAVPST